MPARRLRTRDLKERLLGLLNSEDRDQAQEALCQMPPRQVINPLFSFLLSTDPRIKWATVTAMGAVVKNLAALDMESGRVIMRRLMWQLNDESGGIGWGCPEAMAEVMACHEGLAREYAHVLVSYVMEGGNFLEYDPLQQGAVWGIGRLAQVRPHLVRHTTPHLLPFLEAPNPALRGLAAWALGLLGASGARAKIEDLLGDGARIEIYRDEELGSLQIADLAREALLRIDRGH
jgi:HEAT repeat protein